MKYLQLPLLIGLLFMICAALPVKMSAQPPDVFTDKVHSLKLAHEKGIAGKNQNFKYWDSLLQLARKYKSVLYEFHALVQIGKIHYIQREFPQAELVLIQAMKIGETQHYKRELILPLKLLERTYSTRYDRKQTLNTLYKGLKLAEELNDKKEIIDFNASIGLYYASTKQPDKALKVHLRCLELCKEIGYNIGIASALTDIGSDYIASGEPLKAAPYYLECKKYLHDSPDTLTVISLLTCISAGHGILKESDSALAYINMAYDKAVKMNDPAALASVLTTRAGSYLDFNDLLRSRNDFLLAEKFAYKSHFTAQLPLIYEGLESLFERKGDHKNALLYHRKKDRLADSLSNEAARIQSLEREFAYQYDKKEGEYKLLEQDHQIQSLQYKQNRYLLLGLLILLAAVLIIVWLLRKQGRLKNEYQQLHLQRKLLLSQMNPHFLFNAMNSIHQLVCDRETQQARIYISEFAQLTRRLLESSVKENISLSEEKEILEAYLKMESLRFEGAFSYQVKLDPQLDPLNTCIPHLMIQPFVENAIWHGLLPKQGDKNLLIEINPNTKDTLRCIVEDNGIGRDEAEKKSGSFRKNSLALDFVKQRISLIRKTLRISGALQITDQKDEQGNIRGTKVELILPILSMDYA